MPVAPPTRLDDARNIRALQRGNTASFYAVWNGMAGAVWSVLVAQLESEDEAAGWAMTFRLELAARLSSFALDAPLSAQVGALLVSHLQPTLDAGEQPTPSHPAPESNDALHSLPPAARLDYLVWLFFEVEPLGEQALHAVRRMEPGAHPDERSALYARLLREPPDSILLRAPGGTAPRGRWRWWAAGALFAAAVALLVLCFVPHRSNWAEYLANHQAALAGPIVIGSDPAELATTLARAGVRVSLIEAPDLSPEGLSLVGAAPQDIGGDAEALVLIYSRGAAVWTLQHTGAPLPQGSNAGAAPAEVLVNHGVAPDDLVGWDEAGGSWVLCGPGSGEGTSIATHIRDRRRAPSLDL